MQIYDLKLIQLIRVLSQAIAFYIFVYHEETKSNNRRD